MDLAFVAVNAALKIGPTMSQMQNVERQLREMILGLEIG
ncbi:MAG: GntR family transcriptional regulator, partial [Mesorhizobium sp.]